MFRVILVIAAAGLRAIQVTQDFLDIQDIAVGRGILLIRGIVDIPADQDIAGSLVIPALAGTH